MSSDGKDQRGSGAGIEPPSGCAPTMHQFVCADCLDWSRAQPDGAFAMTFGSPPYENARTYGIGFKLVGQHWVDWMAERVIELCRITRGLVFVNAAGKVKQFKYSPVIEWLVADLTRTHGLVCGPAPYVFHRIGIPGSGGPHYHRRDWEPVYAFARPENLPPKWSDNTAMGHLPKWGPGGEMSNRLTDGQRKNRNQWGGVSGGKSNRKANGAQDVHQRPSHVSGVNQWGHSINSGATVTAENGAIRSKGNRPSHRRIITIPRDGMHSGQENTIYHEPALANPGNVLRLNVGGGQMGSDLAHENEAPFPERLPEFFIRSFVAPGDVVLDPWSGSGTTVAVAVRCGRRGVGVDVRQSQVDLGNRRLATVQRELLP